MPMDDRNLNWIQRNRTRPERAKSVGTVAQEVLASPLLKAPAWRRRLLSVLEEHAGAALLQHADPVSIRNGVLTFQVAEPAVLYHLRLYWEQRLLRTLHAELPAAGINAIRFRCGPRL